MADRWHPLEEFPAFWIYRIFGFSLSSLDKKRSSLNDRKLVKSFQKVLLIFYLFAIAMWFVLFSMASFSYEVYEYNRLQTEGTEKSSSLIVRILDEVPWAILILRNLLTLVLFFLYHERFVEMSEHLRDLLPDSQQSFCAVVQYSFRLYAVAVLVVLVNFIMVLLYLNNINFTDSDWDFPGLFVLPSWQVTILLTLFTLVPFLLAQTVMATLSGLGKGAELLFVNVNQKLSRLAKKDAMDEKAAAAAGIVWMIDRTAMENTSDMSSPLPPPLTRTPIEEDIFSIRIAHFEACHFVDELTDKFSKIFLTVLAGDFIATVGFVGLLIGYDPKPNDHVLFNHLYHALATLFWMGFYLTAQYWPLVQLQEEAERTHNHVQVLSFVPDVTPDAESERELIHFLLATKNGHVGVTAGKLFHFSRHLCVTMITLLCSYAVLVYELLHREATLSHNGSTNATSHGGQGGNGASVARVLQKLEEIVAANYSLKSH